MPPWLVAVKGKGASLREGMEEVGRPVMTIDDRRSGSNGRFLT